MIDKTPQKLLADLVRRAMFDMYITEQTYSLLDLENRLENFAYIHDLTSLSVEENLTEDFEPFGTITYAIHANKSPFLSIVYTIEDGDVSFIDYDVEDENKNVFEALTNYSLSIISEELKNQLI